MIQQVCESLLSATDRCCCYFVCICGKSLLPLPLFLSADVVNQTQQQTHHQHRSKEVLCVSVSVCVCVCVSITHSLPPLCPVCVCVREGAQGNRVKNAGGQRVTAAPSSCTTSSLQKQEAGTGYVAPLL